MYLYALRSLNIKALPTNFWSRATHKMRGILRIPSLKKVSRDLKSGPIYTTDAFIVAIKNAKKTGNPFTVNPLTHEDFFDLRQLAKEIDLLNMSAVKLSDVKVLMLQKGSPHKKFLKHSFEEGFSEETLFKRKQNVEKMCTLVPALRINPKKKEDHDQTPAKACHSKLIFILIYKLFGLLPHLY